MPKRKSVTLREQAGEKKKAPSLLLRQQIIEALHEWRERRKLSLRDAAKILGAHWSMVNRLDARQTSLERLIDMLDKCEDYRLDVSVRRVAK